MSRLRCAVVGSGIAGRQIHVPVVDAHPDLELAAVCDMDESRLRDLPNGVSTYTDAEELYEREAVDSVHVCTPPHTHVDVARQALDRDLPVLVEKPAAPSTEEVQDLMDVAAESEAIASVVHNKLFVPFAAEARRRVERGDVGDVVSVSMQFGEPRDLTESERGSWVFGLPGGEIGEGIAHQVYLPLAFVDGLGEITDVTTQNYSDYEDVAFDGVSLTALDSTGDRLVNVQISTTTVSEDVLHVHGTEGELQVDFLRAGTFRRTMRTADNSVTPVDFLRENLGTAGSLTAAVGKKLYGKASEAYRSRVGDEEPIPNKSHYYQVDRHADAIRTGGDPPVTLEEAYDTVRVLEALGT